MLVLVVRDLPLAVAFVLLLLRDFLPPSVVPEFCSLRLSSQIFFCFFDLPISSVGNL